MVCIFRWINHKSVMVFYNHDCSFESSILQSLNPLICIKVSWIEVLRIFSTISPLRVGISIHTIVDEGSQFFFMVVQLSLAWKWTVSSNFCFFIFWINYWSYRSCWFWIFNLFVFKNNFIHPFMLDSRFLTCIYCTITCNFFGLESMNKGNIVFLTLVIIHSCSCQFLVGTFQTIMNVKGTFINFIDYFNDTSSCRSLAHNTIIIFPSVFQLFIDSFAINRYNLIFVFILLVEVSLFNFCFIVIVELSSNFRIFNKSIVFFDWVIILVHMLDNNSSIVNAFKESCYTTFIE